jgi:hypothetical protein
MRSQYSNKQKLKFIKQGIADYIQNVKNENDRLYSLISKDQFYFAKHDYDNFRDEYFKDNKVIIKRRILEGIIQDKLFLSAPNTIGKWINLTINSGLLSLNHNSSLSAIKGIYKPTPDSRYYINEEKFIEIQTSILEYG